MPFSITHKVTSYLMVLTAVAALIFGSALSAMAVTIALVAIALSWFADPPGYRVERYTTAWNIAALLFLSYLVVRVVHGQSPIIAGVQFLLFVLVNKLFNRRRSKDYQQAYVISFLIMVAATTLNSGISYGVCFFFYVIFATWSLILFHLRREMEDNYLLQHRGQAPSEKVEILRILNSRRVISAGFLAGTSALSVAMVLGAALVFALFPRIGFGLFAGAKRSGMTMTGFSEHVQLGHHGTIENNEQVVMRVVFGDDDERQPPPALTLRWRGSAFDHYENGIWSQSLMLAGRTADVLPEGNLYVVNDAPGLPHGIEPARIRRSLLKQQIYLEPLGSSIIFGADRPVAIEVPPPTVGRRRLFVPRRGPLGEIRASRRRTAGIRYTVYSDVDVPAADTLRQAVPLDDQRLKHFLQLPAQTSVRLRQLARRVTRNAPTIYDKVRAVQSYLRRNYHYTVQLTHRADRDPIDEFLFETRKGHCEYFASAMALMLRVVGVHARHVNGFLGGQWNEFGQYLAVRQSDAHAWTEVLFSNLGWVAFDPTPTRASSPGRAGVMGMLRQMMDTLRLKWFSYVVEYDLAQQVAGFNKVRAMFSGRAGAGSGARSWLRHKRKTLLLAILALIAAGLALWVWRRRRVPGSADLTGRNSTGRRHPATLLYAKALRQLEAAGIHKPACATPQEFADQLLQQNHRCAALVDTMTRQYYTARYQRWDGREAAQLQDLLGQLKRLLR